jgi:hypothetical protein
MQIVYQLQSSCYGTSIFSAHRLGPDILPRTRFHKRSRDTRRCQPMAGKIHLEVTRAPREPRTEIHASGARIQSLARLGPLLAIAASPLQQDFQDLTGCCCVAGFCLDPKRVIIHATDRPASHTHEMWVLGEAVSPALEEFETPQ